MKKKNGVAELEAINSTDNSQLLTQMVSRISDLEVSDISTKKNTRIRN